MTLSIKAEHCYAERRVYLVSHIIPYTEYRYALSVVAPVTNTLAYLIAA
jgi:hypothetical protein